MRVETQYVTAFREGRGSCDSGAHARHFAHFIASNTKGRSKSLLGQHQPFAAWHKSIRDIYWSRS